jgi:hypothetical protein
MVQNLDELMRNAGLVNVAKQMYKAPFENGEDQLGNFLLKTSDLVVRLSNLYTHVHLVHPKKRLSKP